MWKRWILGILLCIGLSVGAYGQGTTLTLNVTDSGSQAWGNGTYALTFVGAPNAQWPGGAIKNFSGSLGATGSVSVSNVPDVNTITPSPSFWQVKVCPNPAISTTQCFIGNFTVTGSTLTLNITPPAISIPVPNTPTVIPPVTAYADAEISGGWVGFQYFQYNAATPASSASRVCQVLTGNACTTWAAAGGGGGGSSATSAGPIINVTNPVYGASSTLADNNAAFTLAATAANNASLTAANPAVKNSVQASCGSCTSLNPTIAIAAGDTVLVFPIGTPVGRTITVTDSGSNNYTSLGPFIANGSSVQVFGSSSTGVTSAATSVTMSISGAVAQINVIVISFTNVGSYRFLNTQTNSGSSATPAITQTTEDNNNILVSGHAWFTSAQTISASANTGVLQQTFTSTPTAAGGAVVTQIQPTAGTSTTNNITTSATTTWASVALELRSRTNTIPVVYIPPGLYNYTGGLSFTQPVILSCQPGATTLNYVGNAHAVDMGATLTANTKNVLPLGVDGCTFTGGANMTEGVTFSDWNVLNYVRNSTFKNFGNSTSHMITGICDNWDMEIGPQNRFILTDEQPRMVFTNNKNACSAASFVRFHDNLAACWQGDAVTVGCTKAQSGIGVILDGDQNRFYHNNFAFWSPDIQILCTSGGCFGNQIDQNIMETSTDTASTNAIQFASGGTALTGTLITQNVIAMHNSTSSVVAPVSGTDIMSGSRINFNTIEQLPAANPVVALNNLVGQTGNYSYSNVCATDFTAHFPCPLTHTAGGNISQWNADQWPTCTMVTGTCAYSFTLTYGAAPKCSGTWNGTGTLSGILKIVTTTTTATATSTVGTDTAVIQMACSAGDSQ